MGYGGENSAGETTSAWQDARDGGGRGTDGPTFVADDQLGILGKLISGFGNMMGGPGGAPFTIGGENNRIPSPPGTSLGRDTIDGGGMGHMGDNHQGMPMASFWSNVISAPFGRDNVTIGKMLQDLETDDDFLNSFVGDTDTTMRKMRALAPARFHQLKQQHLSNNYSTIQPSYNQ